MNTTKNYIYNLLYQITALIVPFITTPYISRVFGPDGVGSYSVSYAIAQYFSLFGFLGLNNFGTRQIAYCRDNHEGCRVTFWDLNYMRFITMGIVICTYVIYVIALVEPPKKLLYWAQLPVLLASFCDISWYFAGIEEFKRTAIRSIIVKIIGLILVFLLVKSKSDVWKYALIISGALFGGQIAMWGTAIKRMKVSKPQPEQIRKFLLSTIKLWIPAIAINVYTSLDKVMLGFISNDTEAGYYENSQRMIKMVSTVTTTFATVMTPRMSNYYINRQYDKLKENVYKSFRFVTLLAVPMVFGIIAVKDTFVPWFFGAEFERVSTLLIVSAWLVLTLSWSNVLGNQVLIACGDEKYYTISVSIAAFGNLILNSIIIPMFASFGAIIASVLAEYTGMFLMMYFSRKTIEPKKLVNGLPLYFISGIIMGICCYFIGKFLGNNVISTLTQIGVGIIIYASIILVFKDELALRIFHKLVKK